MYLSSLQAAVQQLRDRLSRALGQQAVAPAPTQRAQQPAPAAQRGSAQPRHLFTPVQPAVVPQPVAAPGPLPVAASAPAQPQYYQPVCSIITCRSSDVFLLFSMLSNTNHLSSL